MPLLEGEVALVTGAADGIGLAIARRFAAEGACVALADVRAEVAEDAAAAMRDAGHDAIALAMDVGDEDSTEAAVRACVEQFGGLDIAVANAGIIHLAPALDLELAQFRRVLDVNLVGAFLTCRAAARQMVEAGTPGRLILTSSLFGIRGGRGNAAYSASKFGAIGLASAWPRTWRRTTSSSTPSARGRSTRRSCARRSRRSPRCPWRAACATSPRRCWRASRSAASATRRRSRTSSCSSPRRSRGT
jgi:NAD(P)-dependent dehydrogenase (short-subunit alcohol dehydrogenase family)